MATFLTLLLVVLKVTGLISISWLVAFLPVIIAGCVFALAVIILILGLITIAIYGAIDK